MMVFKIAEDYITTLNVLMVQSSKGVNINGSIRKPHFFKRKMMIGLYLNVIAAEAGPYITKFTRMKKKGS